MGVNWTMRVYTLVVVTLLHLVTSRSNSHSLTQAYSSIDSAASPPQSFQLQRALSDDAEGYTPMKGSCPSTPPSIRHPREVSPEEAAWLLKRRANTRAPMRDLLIRSELTGFDAGKYIDSIKDDSSLPNIGLAMSGGGYRALMVGAGALSAFDERTTGSKEKGGLGGLLQATTYLSGLSGGGWLVGSMFVNNFTSVEDIIEGSNAGTTRIWDFERSMLEGPRKSWIPGEALIQYWRHLLAQVKGKEEAGFDTTLTDYWSRGLAYQMINVSHGGPGK
jgi:lysophospholipase